MQTRRLILIGGILATTTLTGILTGCGDSGDQVVAERPAVPVRVQVLQPLTENVTKTYTGSLEGQNQAVIYAKIAEAVDSVLVREGDRVQAGQILLKLDRAGSMSNYQQAQSVYRNAEKNYRKMQTLYEQGAISESQLDASRTDYEVAQAAFEATRQLVEIQSPIPGTVTAVNVRRGDYLSQGQVVATVASTERLRARFDVRPADLRLIAEGDSVRIESESVTGSASGVIASIARSADPNTRAFEVEALIDNAGQEFRPGMFVRVVLTVQRMENVLAVPRAAVLSLSEGRAVFEVVNGVALRRMVTLGPDLAGRVVIDSGLTAGDTVVTLGQSYLDDSTAVQITSVEKGA